MKRSGDIHQEQRILSNDNTLYRRDVFTSIKDPNFNSDLPFIGSSNAFNSILDTIKAIASRKCPVIITGETGVGKEMVARRIHLCSNRSSHVFVPVDCSTLTGQLFESQLFGHVKGAFTGAFENTLGFFRAANKGTIFLDEISEIPVELQAKLLRVLQENIVTPLGSTKSYSLDVRVLCATNRDLLQIVREKKFRSDLYYRLNVVNLEVPPLRERKEDIIPLAKYFLAQQSQFYCEPAKFLSPKVLRFLISYSWPGNVRELANAMERAYILSPFREIRTLSLPPEIITSDPYTHPEATLPTIDAAQRRLITEALEFTGGRKMAAARILGIERRRLNRLIQRLNVPLKKTKRTEEE